MPSFSLENYICFIVVFLIPLFLVWKKTKLPYPPGPQGFPLIGNICNVPSGPYWTTYAEWSRNFHSDVIHLALLGSHVLVVNSFEAACELFEKQSVIYSDRPRLPMLGELVGWNWSLTFFACDDKWRLYRRLFHQYLNKRAVRNFEPQERKATHELLYRLVHKPEDFISHIRLMTASAILSVAYGIEVQSADDPFVVIADKGTTSFSIGIKPGSFLVDIFPILKYVPEWMPGAGFKKIAREWRTYSEHTRDAAFQFVKDQMAKGINTPSVASLSLEELGENIGADTEEAIRGVSGSMYIAGSDTMVAALSTFVLAMVMYPEVVKKAQEELDRVVGQERLPDVSDMPSLPYVGAAVKESLRWNPVTPLGVPHRLRANDVYRGRFMPAGATVIGNIWAMLHNENDYPDPEKFDPDRFLKDGELNPDVRPPEDVAFGFGRRVCPGMHFALSLISLNIACILSVFDIEKAIGEDGNEIIPSGEYDLGLLSHPVPFRCSIKPRSPQAFNLITETYAAHHP